MKSAKDEIIRILNGMVYRKRLDMFHSFIETFAIRLNFAAEKNMIEVRSKRFNEIMEQHTSEDHAVFTKLGNLLIEAFKEEAKNGPTDVLSEIYHMSKLADKTLGESYTSPDVSALLADVAVEPVKKNMFKHIESKGYVSVYDSACGAGSTLLEFAKYMYENNLNYTKQLYAEGWDIDLMSICMAYIQLTMYGIPAKLYHKNTITLEEFSVWRTLTYIRGGVKIKKYDDKGEENKDVHN